MSCGDICLAFLAVFFPPIAVWLKRGLCTADSLLNILLLLLGYLPGLLHAWYIIAKYPDDYEAIPTNDPEAGLGPNSSHSNRNVIYYYVSHTPGMQAPGPAAAGQPDGGRAQREIQRMGSYGAIRGEGNSAQGHGAQGGGGGSGAQQGVGAEGSQGQAKSPPSYAEAIARGDNKVQTP